MEFSVSGKAKMLSLSLIVIGVVAGVLGFLDHDTHGQRGWVNLLINSFFFFGIGLGALFFFALQYVTEASWAVLIKRQIEAVMLTLPIGIIGLLIVFLGAAGHLNHIYHWMDPEVVAHDEIIAGKSGYLNIPFFIIRAVVYFVVFYLFARMFRKRSLKEDQEGGTAIHFKNFKSSAVFIVIFGVFSSTLAWDWIMSIDTHWFSTLFGWYTFSGVWLSSIIVLLVTLLYLKTKGYLPQVNENHIHDVAKWMFALSFLWSYLWFSQFILIWYSDIPEEVTYYIDRFRDYKLLFLFTFFLNFALPMIALMSRPAKRNYGLITVIAIIIFIGHWLDVYLMVTPGTLHNHGTIGFVEIGMMLGFVGLLIYVLLSNLTKAPLTVQNHPYLDESKHHHF